MNNNTLEKINQSGDRGELWLKGKLMELGYAEKEINRISTCLINDKSDDHVIDDVWKRQLEKLGILCLTKSCDNILMWGYYTNNEGFCIEYDFEKLLHDCVIGYINNLSFKLTKYLYETKFYSCSYTERCKNMNSNTKMLAPTLFGIDDISLIENEYLLNKDASAVCNFIYNIFCKRFGYDDVRYSNKQVIQSANLFFDSKNNVLQKYYTKSKDWKHEKELRIVVSLGGLMTISWSTECIRNVYCGCNMTDDKVIAIAQHLSKLNMKHVRLYRMVKHDDSITLQKKRYNKSYK